MMQFPAVTPVTVPPLTVQTPVVWEVKVTGLPEAPPAALTVPVPPTTTEGAVPKVIVWSSLSDIVMSLKTGVDDESLVDNSTLYWIHSLFALNNDEPLLEQIDQGMDVALGSPVRSVD